MQTVVFHIVDFDMFQDRPLKNPVHGLGFYLFTVKSMKTTITTYKIDRYYPKMLELQSTKKMRFVFIVKALNIASGRGKLLKG